jgi:hypothetical protein
MSFRSNPDTFYTKLPTRRIVGRFTLYSAATVAFPEGYFVKPMVVLDCNHEVDDRGQKSSCRCWKCGVEQGLYDRK